MFSPIIKQPKKKKQEDIRLSQEQIERLLAKIYEVLLAYGSIKKIMATEDNPIWVGNVKFWFGVSEKTGSPQLNFKPSVAAWDEDAIELDLEQHYHNIYYGNS